MVEPRRLAKNRLSRLMAAGAAERSSSTGRDLQEIERARFGPYQEDADCPNDTELRVTGEGFMSTQRSLRPATDDWPFVYLPRKSFPAIYLAGLAVIATISLAGLVAVAPRGTLRRFDWHMFFLGVAFALLEVKALITFALLFGSTWNVNSLVFFAILAGVLAGRAGQRAFPLPPDLDFLPLLFGMLVLNLSCGRRPALSNAPLRYMSRACSFSRPSSWPT